MEKSSSLLLSSFVFGLALGWLALDPAGEDIGQVVLHGCQLLFLCLKGLGQFFDGSQSFRTVGAGNCPASGRYTVDSSRNKLVSLSSSTSGGMLLRRLRLTSVVRFDIPCLVAGKLNMVTSRSLALRGGRTGPGRVGSLRLGHLHIFSRIELGSGVHVLKKQSLISAALASARE